MKSEEASLEGWAFAPASSERMPATLLYRDNGSVSCYIGSQVFILSPDELEFTEALGSIPRCLKLPGGWVFQSGDEQHFNSWVSRFEPASTLHLLERSRVVGVVAIALVAIVAAWFVWDGAAMVSRQVANVLPASVAQYVGENTWDLLDGELFSPTTLSDEQQAAVQSVFGDLVSQYEFGALRPRLFIRQWEGPANAFALADGTVVLTDKMVELAESDAELSSVLLHELAHVLHQDVMAQLVQASVLSIIVSYMVGDLSAIGDTLVGVGVFAISMDHSREAELEADRFAAEGMLQYYGTVDPMINLFSRFEEPEGTLPQWLHSHDSTKTRIVKLQDVVAAQ
ncbi:MAG: M48 family metallopeptidase [Oleiphilaceae bacterium]|nr:M48 family metallopeptidase [Oleiphilaceae bacterium]